MEYGGELMSRRANLIKEYLEETQKLTEVMEKAGTESFELEEFKECVDRRGEIVSKIKETDGLLSRESIAGDKSSPEVAKYKWLCDRFLQQIAEAEEKNEPLLMRVLESYQDVMRRNSDSIKGLNAYFQFDRPPEPSKEWKK